MDDAAEAIVSAAERYDGSDPVNIGSGHEIRIKALVQLIAEVVGFEGRLVWDRAKPDGQPRRLLDCSRTESAFDFRARTTFRHGLQRTVAWHLDHAREVSPSPHSRKMA